MNNANPPRTLRTGAIALAVSMLLCATPAPVAGATAPLAGSSQWAAGALGGSSAAALRAAASTSSFADISAGAPFAAEIYWLADKGISTGWPEPDGTRTYRPLAPVNRDAMAAFMHRLEGAPDFSPPLVSPLVDVAPVDMFFKEIIWITASNISTGWDEGNGTTSYRPGQAVNRDAMAAFMYRLAERPAFTPPTMSPFADVPTDSLFYHEITWLAAQGISTGWAEADGSRTFRPLQPVNRDAMAAFMYRFISKSSWV